MIRILMALAIFCFSAAPVMADEFGSRFGNSSPYALQNTFDKAQQDTEGFGLDDLLDIEPAAGGEEMDAENAAEETSVEDSPAETPDASVVPGVDIETPKAEDEQEELEL